MFTTTTQQDIPEAVVGGGYLVLRRNSMGRLKAPRCPYEHGSLASAEQEAARMSKLNPGRAYPACYVVSEHVEPDDLIAVQQTEQSAPM